MSQAADDLTDNPRYQNVTVRVTSPSPSTNTIRPHATVGDGVSATILRSPGNTGVFLVSESVGGSYVVGGTVNGVQSEALEGLLLRIS